jgi:mono/diheme cytochrome c family protein
MFHAPAASHYRHDEWAAEFLANIPTPLGAYTGSGDCALIPASPGLPVPNLDLLLMKFAFSFIASTLVAGSAAFVWMKTAPAPPSHAEKVARGEYLVKLGGCADCHTPKIMTAQGPVDDKSRAFSGHPADVELPPAELGSGPWGAATAGMTAWAGPWGVSYAANLTSDPATGLFSEQTFIAAMRSGKKRGFGRDILPPMPWQPLSEASEDDLKAIYAYLCSLPPVHNSVPEPTPPVASPRSLSGGTPPVSIPVASRDGL